MKPSSYLSSELIGVKMNKCVLLGIMVLVLSPMPDVSHSSDLGPLDEHLLFLEPLISHEWDGGYVGEDAPEFVISLKFESILAGKAVKYTREVPALGYLSETYFYWRPDREEVHFLGLNSRGIVGEGTVSLQNGDIVFLGESGWEDGTQEFKTILHLNEEGVLRDTFFQKENGAWVQGHIQEFAAKEATTIPTSTDPRSSANGAPHNQ